MLFFCFFLKQKTAYEMRISDWSSDVCSSDLRIVKADVEGVQSGSPVAAAPTSPSKPTSSVAPADGGAPYEEQKLNNVRKVIARRLTEAKQKIGRASCRERVCQYV